jgi:hypothetical protein
MNFKAVSTILAFVASFNLVQAQYDYPPPGGGGQRGRRIQEPEKQVVTGNPTGFVSINFGACIPEGSFSNNVSSRYGNYGSYALPGSFEAIAAGIPLNHTNFGIALMLGFYTNPMDMGNYTNNFGNSDSAFSNQASSYQFSAAGYSATTLMAGLYYTYPMGRFSLDLRGLVGIAFCGLPDVYFVGLNYLRDQTDTWEISGTNTVGFASDLGVGLRCVFRRNTCAMLNIDYTQVNTSYSTTMEHDYYYNWINATQYSTTYGVYSNNRIPVTGSMVMSLVTLSLGVGYQFGGH